MLCLIHGLKQESPEAEKNKAKNKIIKSWIIYKF
jgi:hypothetical protein